MAEYLFKEFVKGKDIEVSSAGTHAEEGMQANPLTIEVMKEKKNIDVSSHRTKHLTLELINESDYIFVMSEEHKKWIIDMDKNAEKKIRLLNQEGIFDPIGKPKEEYEKCLEIIENSIKRIINEILV
jgi:protein-tyrosine phosphatase